MSSKIMRACMIALCVLVNCVFLACSNAFADMSFYANQGKGFCIEFPENWHVQDDPVVVVCATKFLSEVSDDETVPPNIKVSAAKLANGMKLKDYYNNSAKVYSTIWKVTETKDLELDGNPAKRVDLEQTLGIIETRVLKVFVQSGDNIFVISCSANPQAFSKYKDLFEQSIASFKVIKQGGSTSSATSDTPVATGESTPSPASTPSATSTPSSPSPQPQPTGKAAESTK